jgi:hypothetical protein
MNAIDGSWHISVDSPSRIDPDCTLSVSTCFWEVRLAPIEDMFQQLIIRHPEKVVCQNRDGF